MPISLNPHVYPVSSQRMICAQGGNCARKRFAPVPTEALLAAWQENKVYLWCVCHSFISFSAGLGFRCLTKMACFMRSQEKCCYIVLLQQAISALLTGRGHQEQQGQHKQAIS